MLMFIDMGGGGVDEEITDYVDMGRGLQKKRDTLYVFRQNFHIFNILSKLSN